MAPASALQLLDLPPDLLARIGAQLPFNERLQLSLVCRRWRDVCAGPSQLWGSIDARICRGVSKHTGGLFQPCVDEFARWFAKRAQGVGQLRLKIEQPEAVRGGAYDDTYCLHFPASLLRHGSKPQLPLPLRKLALDYYGHVCLDFGAGDVSPAGWLPELRKMALFDVALTPAPPGGQRWPQQALPHLTDFSLIEGTTDAFRRDDGWLPPSLTAVVLSEGYLSRLPSPLTKLKHLRSLVLDNNDVTTREEDSEEFIGLQRLSELGSLEELNLSNNPLLHPPSQLSALRQLRILYLHEIVTMFQGQPPPPEAWDPLRACTALAFLSISGNGLPELPPAVADMAHLQALHCEENDIAALPAAPYLSNLRELLADWRTLMASTAFLPAATQLSRLIMHRFQPAVPPLFADEGQPLGPLPGAGEALLAALASLPCLRRVDDVYEEDNHTHLVTAEMAHVMWQLGKRCPHLELTQPRSTNLGWTLSSLVAELPHNAGTAVLRD